MSVFEQMMSNLPCLRHLELVSYCDSDVIDGYRWEKKVEKLDTFEFMFHFSLEIRWKQQDSFRTPFWLNEKQWYVAYIDGYLFSVPRFIPFGVTSEFRLPSFTTVPNNQIFYKHTDILNLTEVISRQNGHFPNVHTLELSFVPSLSNIKRIIDLQQVRCLTLFSVDNISLLQTLINEMLNLYEISIYSDVQSFIQHVHDQSFNRIRRLQIRNRSADVDDCKIEDLCLVFPYLKHLQVNYRCSMEKMFDVLRRFKYLSTASFDCKHWFDDADEDEEYSLIQSIFEQMRCKHELHCTYRFHASMVYFWILSQSNLHPI